MKKPRADSILKTLPVERQAEIFEHAATHTLVETAAWLRADGVKTSKSAVSDFCAWYGLQQQMRQNESTVQQVIEDLRQQDPNISQTQLDVAGNLFFSALAIQEKDSLAWKRTKDAQTRAELARLSRIKLQRECCELFLKWVEDKRAKEIASDGSMSRAQQIEALGRTMFEDWEQAAPASNAKK